MTTNDNKRKLKVLRPIALPKPKYVVSKRHMLKPPCTLPLSDTALDKLTFKERIRLQFENAVEFTVVTVQEYGYVIKVFLLGMLFVSTFALTLIMFQKNIDKTIAEPLQKIYDMVISDFNI